VAERPDQLWLAGITYLPTYEGWLFLAVVMDVYRAAESAIRTLHELGYGRPKSDGDGEGAGFVLKRVIVLPSGAEVMT
jgi:hypothetical protein